MAFTNQTVPINKIMEYFYQVPDYQRGYVWDQERVTDFLHSIIGHFRDNPSSNYFLGAAVFESSQENKNKYFVVDGQQRLSTIFVTICAAYNILKKLNVTENDTLNSYAEDFLRKYNRKEKNYELKIQHADKDCIQALQNVLEDKDQTPENVSRSAENIYVAYREVKKILINEYQISESTEVTTKTKKIAASQLEAFIDYFEHITVLPFISQSRDESLTVFETLNSKGLSLSNIDILKSILFDSIKEDDEEWERLSKNWNEFQTTFEPLKIPANKFLRYAVVTQFGENISSKDCLKWLKENESRSKIKSNPKDLITMLNATAVAIKGIRNGTDKDGNKNMYLINMRRLAPSAEQQYFMLIPLWNSEKIIFEDVCAVSESVLFVNKMLAHYTGSTEKNFIEWGKSLAAIRHDKALCKEYINTTIRPLLNEEKSKLEAVLLESTWKNTNRTLIGWILKRCELYAAAICKDDVTNGVDKFSNVDIEHIEPQSANELNDSLVQALGNLTIQEKGFNRANGNKRFDEKLSSYNKSAYKMTNAISGMPSSGGAAKAAFEIFYSANSWGGVQIQERTAKIVSLILNVLQFQDKKLI